MVAAAGSGRPGAYAGSSGPRHSSQVAEAEAGWGAWQSLHTSGSGRGPRLAAAPAGMAVASGVEPVVAGSSTVVMSGCPRPTLPTSIGTGQQRKAPGAKKTLGTRGFLAFV